MRGSSGNGVSVRHAYSRRKVTPTEAGYKANDVCGCDRDEWQGCRGVLVITHETQSWGPAWEDPRVPWVIADAVCCVCGARWLFSKKGMLDTCPIDGGQLALF